MADEKLIMNKGDRAQDSRRTSRPGAVSTLHYALADKVCSPETTTVKTEPPDVNNDVCSTDDIPNVKSEVSHIADEVCFLEMDTAVKNEPLDVNNDVCLRDGAGNEKTEGSHIWIEVCPLDPAALVKQEMHIEPTVLQPPDIKYNLLPRNSDPENNVAQMESHRVGNDNLTQRHLLPHAVEDNYDICNPDISVTFTKNVSDRTSKKLHRPHGCYICNKTFTERRNLNKHMYTHTGVRPHRCDVCNKYFSDKKALNRHTLTHTGVTPHQCDVCQKYFSERSHLKRHMLTHTGEKPHFCGICNKHFSEKGTLNRHMLTHTGVRRHHCDICDKHFAERNHLKRHMLTHTGERPHRCEICNRDFSQNSNLKTHMITHTGMTSNKGEYVQYDRRTSRFTISTLHNTLADKVCPPEMASAVIYEPSDVNDDVRSTVYITNVKNEAYHVSD